MVEQELLKTAGEFHEKGTKNLVARHTTYIELEGDYVEKEVTYVPTISRNFFFLNTFSLKIYKNWVLLFSGHTSCVRG